MMTLRATVMLVATALMLGATAMPSPAAALPPLREVKEIDSHMLWIGLAIEISDRCNRIEPRTIKGLLTLNSLRSQAVSMGYSNGEIKSYVKSDQEKARIRKLGESYVKSQGLDPKNDADLCKLGDAEIARGSEIGVLLKAK